MRFHRPRPRTLLTLVAAVAVAFALAAAWTVQRAESRADDRAVAAREATGAAARALPVMLGYEYSTIEKDLDAATAVMTPSFAKKYTELAPQLIEAAEQRRINVDAQVRAIAPMDCGDECSTSTVRVLAFVDQHRTIDGKPGSPAALSVVLTMRKSDGDWLIADLKNT